MRPATLAGPTSRRPAKGGARVSLVTAWACALAALAPAVAAAQQNVEFTVSGTSTIRGWTCTAPGKIAVTPGSGAPVTGFAKGVQSATVTVRVNDFTCPNPEMRDHLLQAMRADKFAEIVYRLETYELAGSQVQASGTMTITGSSQPFTFPMMVKAGTTGVEFSGSTRLDMTAYGVDPPVVMGGLLKVGPQIRIQFKGVFTP